MYSYSPIKKLYIKNFRNLGEVEIDFSESPIITLVGENEAGKTSVIKAFATCALHANPRDQKDCIRDGTKMFGVAIDLDDGTRIVRMKEASALNSYQLIGADGKLIWSTNKITDGLPAEIQKVMGLIEEPETSEFLHIRTYEDKLLFVVTPNSTNYKVMYNALKVEQLTKAIKLGSTEVNALKSQINNNDISMQTLQGQLKAIQIVDTEPLVTVRDRLLQQMAYLDKLEHAKALIDKINNCEIQLGALALIDKFSLEPINELSTSKLASINKILCRQSEICNLLNIYKDADNIQEIDVSVFNKLLSLVNKKVELSKKVDSAGALVQLTEISEISEVRVVHLNKIIALMSKVRDIENQLSCINISDCTEVSDIDLQSISKINRVKQLKNTIDTDTSSLSQINTYIEQVQDYMKQCGVAVETCPKCGESIIFDIDKLN